jgi:putative ABC transport system permease protein
VTFVRPISASAQYDVTRLPGVRRAEAFRAVPVRLRAGPRSRYLAVLGVARGGTLMQVIDGANQVVSMPADGLVLSRKLADLLGVGAGDRLSVEVLEADRPVREMTITRLIDDYMGLNAYMDAEALHRLLHEGPLVSGAYLSIDPRQTDVLYARLTETPAVAGVALKQATVDTFEQTLSETIGTSRTITVVFAAIIAFGVVYNTARVALSERGRELATLRVIGMTRGEIAGILFGEWTIVTLVALPLGLAMGYGLAALTVQAFSTDVYRLPLVVAGRTYLWSLSTVVTAAGLSALIVRRRLDRLDLIAVLKTRE